MDAFLKLKFLVVFIFSVMGFSSYGGDLVINFENLNSQGGNLLINVFNNSDGFPDEFEKSFTNRVIELTTGASTTTVRIEGLPAGDYGVAVVQDINKNLKLDTNFLGIPKEPVGFSRNPRLRRNLNFYEVVFTLPQAGGSTSIRMASLR